MKKILLITVLIIGALMLLGALLLVRGDIPVEELRAKYANAASRFVEIEGMPVHYRDQESGPPLVLLHGTSASLHTWEGWTAALKDTFRVVRMDLPGFGLTGPHPRRDYSIAAYVRFLNTFLDSLEIDSCYLAGNSLGGRIAWEYALAHPRRVEKLILIDASGYPHDSLPLVFRLAHNPVTAFLMHHLAVRGLVEKSLKEVYADDSKVSEALVERYQALTLREGNRRALVDRMNTRFSDHSGRIPHIQTPTLILWGAQDRWIPVENARRFHNELSNSQLIIYPNAGHVPMEELPQRSAADARQFLLGN